jgi:hypothetical protein
MLMLFFISLSHRLQGCPPFNFHFIGFHCSLSKHQNFLQETAAEATEQQEENRKKP